MTDGDMGVLGRSVDSLLRDGDGNHRSMSGQVDHVTALHTLEVVAVHIARLPQVPTAPLACLELNHHSTSLHTHSNYDQTAPFGSSHSASVLVRCWNRWTDVAHPILSKFAPPRFSHIVI